MKKNKEIITENAKPVFDKDILIASGSITSSDSLNNSAGSLPGSSDSSFSKDFNVKTIQFEVDIFDSEKENKGIE